MTNESNLFAEEIARIAARNTLLTWLEEKRDKTDDLFECFPYSVMEALIRTPPKVTLVELVEWLWEEELAEALALLEEQNFSQAEWHLIDIYRSHPTNRPEWREDPWGSGRELAPEMRRYHQYECYWKRMGQRELP